MEKKNYTTPALSVEEFEMTEVICTSIVNSVNTNLEGKDALHISPTGGTGNARANSRGGIWDEE